MSIIIYQEEIELLEEEKAELQREVLALRRRIKYFQAVIDEEEDILLRSTLWMDPLDGHDWEHGIQVI